MREHTSKEVILTPELLRQRVSTHTKVTKNQNNLGLRLFITGDNNICLVNYIFLLISFNFKGWCRLQYCL